MRRHSYLIAGGVAALGVAGAVAFVVTRSDKPAALEDLERAQSASERASEQRERIVANLEKIEENLAAGAGISEKSEAIDELTQKQAESLEDLSDLLRDQLRTLNRTQGALSSTSRAASGVAELGAEQLRLLRRAIAALTDLRGHVKTATDVSRTFAQRARYGAKLAKDSQEAFGGP